VSKTKASWLPLTVAFLIVGSYLVIALPKKVQAGPAGSMLHLNAVPQFARRYNLKCSACHTIVPVLNEQGFMFKRLGYRLPPSLEKGQPAPKISDLVKKEPQWTLANNVAPAVTDFSYSAERTTQEGASPASTSSFQVASWNMYMGGWLPDTNFWYYAEFDIVSGGSTNPDLGNAYFGYTGGNARSSWYAAGGREHIQIGEGTRAAQVYSLLPSGPLLFENSSPTNFVVDQSPVGIDVGYTWASSNYRNIFAATVKVTNGDNADGSEILGPSTRNSKDVYARLDYWYAPESGVTFKRICSATHSPFIRLSGDRVFSQIISFCLKSTFSVAGSTATMAGSPRTDPPPTSSATITTGQWTITFSRGSPYRAAMIFYVKRSRAQAE
jgi:hypothetical protein